MGALDKLINLLEQVKETNPDFSSKAEKALDVLVGDDEEEVLEESEPEPEPEPEPFDDTYVEIEDEDIYRVVGHQQSTSKLVTQLGLLTQNYEVDKEVTLEEMEKTQRAVQLLMKQLKEKYNLDGAANYDLVFPSDNAKNPNKAAFVKK
ncbi:MAG: hypothetical protein HOJ16_07770 [Candidatus Peribacter sp.]|jgi:hypothetical protein|nr:hypothetical protein [Candidatus Peribacter sp.]